MMMLFSKNKKYINKENYNKMNHLARPAFVDNQIVICSYNYNVQNPRPNRSSSVSSPVQFRTVDC